MKNLIIKILGMITVWTDMAIEYVEVKTPKRIIKYVAYSVLGIATVWSIGFWIIILSCL